MPLSLDLRSCDEVSLPPLAGGLARVIIYSTGKLFSDVSCRIITYVRQPFEGRVARGVSGAMNMLRLFVSDHRALPRAIAEVQQRRNLT